MKKKEFLKDILIFLSLLLNSVTYFLSGFSKRKENYIIFGAWGGNKYNDNPRYLLESFREDPSLKLFWVGKATLENLEIFKEPNVYFLKRNSLKAHYIILRAKHVYFSNSYRDLGYLNLLKGATVTQLWHGFGLKNTLSVKRDISKIKKLYYTIGQKTYEKYDFFISSSPYNTKKILETFQYNGIHEENIIKSGQPKNDFLLNKNNVVTRELHKKRFCQKYGIPQDKKIISYLPTFRDHDKTFQFNKLDAESKKKLQELLQRENALIIEKMHFADTLPFQENGIEDITILSIEPKENSENLLLISDILISDYSSCYLDFTLRDRPIIHFTYDLGDYKEKDRGLYYPLEKYNAGPIIEDFESLLKALEENLKEDAYAHKRNNVRQTLMEYEKGRSSEIIKKHTLKK